MADEAKLYKIKKAELSLENCEVVIPLSFYRLLSRHIGAVLQKDR